MASSAALKDDLVLLVEGEEIPCCKEALRNTCEYFNAMFTSQMRETTASSIELKDVSLHSMKWLVEFSKDPNRNKFKFEDVTDACQILHTACVLQCLGVIGVASKYVKARLSPDNCLNVMCLADMHALNHLYNLSRRKALWEFPSVSLTTEFLELSVEIVKDYLSCNMLNAASEKAVLDAAVRWVEFDLDSRKDCYCDILSCVRLNDVGCEVLMPYLIRQSVLENPQAQQAIAQAVDQNLQTAVS